MKLFLDASVLLTAAGSGTGASREIFRRASANHWLLVATPYVIEEVLRNIRELPPSASADWARLRPVLLLMDDVLTLDRPHLFGPTKDRPVLFSAVAWSDVLLTLDNDDFTDLMGTTSYGLLVLSPGAFLKRERAAGRLRG